MLALSPSHASDSPENFIVDDSHARKHNEVVDKYHHGVGVNKAIKVNQVSVLGLQVMR